MKPHGMMIATWICLSSMLLACSLASAGTPAPGGSGQPGSATALPSATLPPLVPGTETNPTQQPPTLTPVIRASVTPTPTVTLAGPTATPPSSSTGPLNFAMSIVGCRIDPAREGGVILTLRFDATGGNGAYTYYRENQQVPRTFERPATKGSAVIDAFRVTSGDGQSIERKERFTGAQFGCP